MIGFLEVLVSVAVTGAGAAALAMFASRGARRMWLERALASAAIDLRLERPELGAEPILQGEVDGFDVLIMPMALKNNASVTATRGTLFIQVDARPWLPEDMILLDHSGRAPLPERVPTGDPEFDALYSVTGPPERVAAILSEPVRRQLVGTHDLEANAGFLLLSRPFGLLSDKRRAGAWARALVNLALRIRKDQGSTPARLLDNATHDPVPDVRAKNLDALWTAHPESPEALTAAYRWLKPWDDRRRAIEALHSGERARLISAVCTLGLPPAVRMRCLAALITLFPDAARSALSHSAPKLVRDLSGELRARLLHWLRRFDIRNCQRELIAMLDGGEADAREQAIRTLAVVGGPAAAAALRRLRGSLRFKAQAAATQIDGRLPRGGLSLPRDGFAGRLEVSERAEPGPPHPSSGM